MLLNFLIWIMMGLLMGMLGYIFDVNKQKGLLIYLAVGVIAFFGTSLAVHFVLWPEFEKINLVAVVIGALITYPALRTIDYFFHL